MKIPRFITEYANFKIEGYKDLQKRYPTITHYQESITQIERVVIATKKGFLTYDEAIKSISNL